VTFPSGLSRSQYRHNIIALVGDASLFYIAMSFIGATTVLPALLGTLTDSKLAIGVGSGITRGAWLLPQLLVAGLVARVVHRKKVIVGAAWISRPLLLIIALVIWRYAVSAPTLTLVVVLALLFVFFALDAVVSVPWFDHLARTISHQRRGMVVGLGQVLGGVGGIGTGAAVGYLLSERSPFGYPANYAVVYAIGGAILMLSAVAISFIADPDCTPKEGKSAPSLRQTMAMLPRIMGHDRSFRRLISVQLLVGFSQVATAFYVLYATRELGFTLGDTGLFVSAQVTGSMIAGFILGYIQNRLGPLVHIRLQTVLAMAAPCLALFAGPIAGADAGAVRWVYMALYLMLGVYIGGGSWPFNNWLLEYAVETQRPMYLGLANTLSAVTMLAPVLGGAVVDAVSYPAVFVLALCFCATALALSFGLPSTRAKSEAGSTSAAAAMQSGT
jgi:MFS family permease